MDHCILQYLLFQNELPMSLPQNPKKALKRDPQVCH
jgi:hypothetical protein